MDKLKSCPFCDGIAWLEHNGTIFKDERIGKPDGYRVVCQRYGVCCANSGWWHTKEQAIKAWNKRIEFECKKVVTS